VILKTKRFILKPLLENNATQSYINWLIDFRNSGQGLKNNKIITITDLKNYIIEKNNSDILFLGIFLRNKILHIGNIKFEPLDYKKNQTTMGILIGDLEWRSKGVFNEIIIDIEKYLVKIGIFKINLAVSKTNLHAIHVYKKNNFKVVKDEEKDIFMSKKIKVT